MRKDVKLGLAVGGVLLAVLVVYVLVVPGNKNQVGATLEPLDGSESVASAAELSSSAGGATASRGETMHDDDATGGTALQESQARIDGVASADAPAQRDPEDANRGASTNDRARGETADGGWNWDALVNGTEKLPSLGATTDVPTHDVPTHHAGIASANGGSSDSTAEGNLTSFGNASPATGSGTSGDLASSTTTENRSPAAPDAAGFADATAAGSSQAPAGQSTAEAQPRSITPAPIDGLTRTYVVKVGETYSSISAAAYGSSKYYAHIEQANPGIDPTRLKPGMTITLPAIEAKPAPVPAVAQQQFDPRTQYKVQPNDSLYTISLRLYGKADRVQKLYELNKSTIGDDMARVKVGTVLKLPEPPTQSTAAAVAQ
ncbi:MAG TPA: LysM domain-containing protein [Tepidisphaeraceae bacterium]|nr:LysM domain-containing protein [Tepidisphaeraceae bacterium]